jgi:hypothetical protein
MTTRHKVQSYLEEGWAVIPIPKGSKAPEIKDWVNRAFSVEDFEEESNVGVRLGEASGHLTDVDLDCPEAVTAAKLLLPATERKHGRPSTGDSHYFYVCLGAKSEKWTDLDGKVLVEIRSTGAQTVIPPSVHPSGDVLYWASERTPTTIEPKALSHHARHTATAALLARHWPGQGSRHACAAHLAGFLAARDLDLGTVCKIVESACTIAGDVAELDDRIRAAADTVKNFAAGGKIAGGPSLEDHVGKDVVALLSKWYGGNAAVFQKLIAELNASRFGARLGKDYVYGLELEDEVVFQRAVALHEEFANQRVAVGTKPKGEPVYKTKFEIWRQHPDRRSYRRVIFAPPPRDAHPEDYNLWKGFAVAPLRPTPEERVENSIEAWREWADRVAKPKCQAFLDFIFEVICSKRRECFDYLIKWMAFSCQFPGIPIETAVMLLGDQGTGKGTFARGFGSLFGRHFIQLDKAEQLAGKFNVSLSAKAVVFADEAFFAGDRKDLGSLKRLITEPTLAIERKGIDLCVELNCVHLLLATNAEWAVNAARQERRFLALRVSNVHLQDHDYFTAVAASLDQGGREALLAYLLTREVVHNEVRKVLKTKELGEQQALSLDPEMQWWREKLHDGHVDTDAWPSEISSDDLFASYKRWCEEMKTPAQRRVTKIDLIRRALAPWLGTSRIATRGENRDKRVRPLLPLAEARRVFAETLGNDVEWEDATDATERDGSEESIRRGLTPFDTPF